MSTADMVVVIDFELLRGRQKDIVVKELSVAVKRMVNSFRFRSPYSKTSYGSDGNGLNLENGHVAYHDVYMVLGEAVTGFAHLYFYIFTKCKFLTEILGRPILNLQDFN